MNQHTTQLEGPFDGEMIIIADREICAGQSPLLTSVITRSGHKSISGSPILELLAIIEETKTLGYKDGLSPAEETLLRQKILEANNIVETLLESKTIYEKLLETLLTGRMKVGLWIDSIGGEVDQEDTVNWSVDYLDRQKASVHTYVGTKACSAAFDLTFLGNEISALSRSVFMWHLSDSPDFPRTERIKQLRGKGTPDAAVSEEINDLLEILDRTDAVSKEELIAEILRQINNPRNHDGTVYFEGDYLKEMGLVDNAFRSITPLVDKFKSDFPLHAELNVTYFTTAIAEKVYKAISHLPTWLDRAPMSLTGKFQRQLERP